MDIISHRKVHLCPLCKNRLDRVEYSDGSVKWQCHAPFSEPPYICAYELQVIKNDHNEPKV